MQLSRGKIVIILFLMSLSIGMMVYSFAFTTISQVGTETNYLTVSDISFGLTDSTTNVNLGAQTPMLDKFGLENAAFSFSINNTASVTQSYTLRLVDSSLVSTIPNNEIRYQLTVGGISGEVRSLSDGGAIDSGVIEAGVTKSYSLKVWLSYDATFTEGTWDKVISVEAGTTNIDDSGANEPIIVENMIPVYYDGNDGVWRKADVTNSNIEHQWYDYGAKMWANAVTVSSTNRDTLLTASEGAEIPMDDINFMWVWIPRYKYTIFNKDLAAIEKQVIDVEFEKGISSTGTMVCNISSGSQLCRDEKNNGIINGTTTYTHPAFNFKGEELTGIWVSKFELSADSSETCSTSVTSANCNKGSLVLSSKPNQKSLYYISLSNLFMSVRRMELGGNIYGFEDNYSSLGNNGIIEDDENTFDTHVIKNLEMGAVTYLTYSKYGKYTNIDYNDSSREIFENSSTTTGNSYVDNISYEYNINYYGTGASTTGNIYGIYDLSGYVAEMVMGNVLNSSGEFTNGSSNFTVAPSKEYYDTYSYVTSGSSLVSYYGDGTKELNGFYTNGNSSYPYSSNPFFKVTRPTYIQNTNGNSSYQVGGRAVLTIDQDIYITKW